MEDFHEFGQRNLLHYKMVLKILPEEESNTIIELLDKSLKIVNGLINYYQKADLK